MANGALGTLREVVIDDGSVDRSRSSPGCIVLKTAPKYIVVELVGRKPGDYTNLGGGQVPIYPTKRNCEWTYKTLDGTAQRKQFQRTQLPVTPAFAFTDYKCQGTTLGKVVVDFAGGVSSSGMYVMLSRVQRREDLLVLQHFQPNVLHMRIPQRLKSELDRLDKLAKKTHGLIEWPHKNLPQ